MLSPKLHKGFAITVIDMDHTDNDRIITLNVPEQGWEVAALLQNPDRFAIESVHSRHKEDEQIVAVSATRLHNISGVYSGKDDPICLIRTQGMFPAPEELVAPYMLGHFVSGGARGSHTLPIMPTAINTPVGRRLLLAAGDMPCFSMDAGGRFTEDYVDVFSGGAWDCTRLKVRAKTEEWRRQGFISATMASRDGAGLHRDRRYAEILDERFETRK